MSDGLLTPGRRGAFLILFGVAHIVIGASYAQAPGATSLVTALLTLAGLPLWVAAIPWVVSGACAITAGCGWPPGRDGWGFQALIAMETAWALTYAAGWLTGHSPRGWVLAAIFAAMGTAVYMVSGMVSVTALLPGGDQESR